eukprot:g37361.t1
MRRQLKIQGKSREKSRDQDPSSCPVQEEKCDRSEIKTDNHKMEKASYPWPGSQADRREVTVAAPFHTVVRGIRDSSSPSPSPEEIRSCSIATLRAKAREHEAEIHSGAAKPLSVSQSSSPEHQGVNDEAIYMVIVLHIIVEGILNVKMGLCFHMDCAVVNLTDTVMDRCIGDTQ